MVKHLSAMQETWVRSLGWEDPLEKEMAAHSSTLAWKIPWTEEPGGLQPMGSQSQTRLSDLIFSCSMRTPSCGIQWDPVVEPSPPALGVQSFSRWTTREAPSSPVSLFVGCFLPDPHTPSLSLNAFLLLTCL